jgi:ABC-2 type transport system ATP-binding protein
MPDTSGRDDAGDPGEVARFSGVSKWFGKFAALQDISLELHRAEVVALLGHNGAGKTATVRLLATLSWPTVGRVFVAGYDSRRQPLEIRKRIGVCLDDPLLWPDLTGPQVLRLIADAYGVPQDIAARRSGDVLERLRFVPPGNTLVGQYSLGMKRKLGLVASLLGSPLLVVWDEPEIGLDAPSRVVLRELVRDLRQQGTAVFITTHSIDLAEAMADRVAVLCAGRLVGLDTPVGLRRRRGYEESLEKAFMALLEEAGGRDYVARQP